MANNLFDKVDNVSQKVDDIDRKIDDLSEVLKAINTNASSAQSSTPFTSQVNETNSKLALQNFIRRSKKYYHFLGGVYHFKKEKRNTWVYALCFRLVQDNKDNPKKSGGRHI